MEISEIEEKYLSKNHSFHIENKLLSTFAIEDIQDFITPLYKEYEEIKKDIELKVVQEKSKYEELGELGEYFIEKVIEMMNDGERRDKLEKILYKFNSHLYSYFPQKYPSKYKSIDISEIPIARIIGMYTKLPSYYKRRNIHCPLHKDKTPSFKIYEHTNSFFCFGCNRGGNVLNFISYMENISTKEAYKKLVHQFG